MQKNFSIFKVDKKSDKQPDYEISMKVGEDFVKVGACWIKDGKNGKYLSCKLSDAWVDHTDRTKTRKGYSITEDVKREEGEARPEEIDMNDAANQIRF